MERIVDITEKLSFEENPCLLIKGEKLEVNADAPTVLKVMGLMGNEDPGVNEILEAYNMIFTESAKKKLGKMKLNFQDLITVIQEAVSVIVGDDKNQGEQ